MWKFRPCVCHWATSYRGFAINMPRQYTAINHNMFFTRNEKLECTESWPTTFYRTLSRTLRRTQMIEQSVKLRHTCLICFVMHFTGIMLSLMSELWGMCVCAAFAGLPPVWRESAGTPSSWSCLLQEPKGLFFPTVSRTSWLAAGSKTVKTGTRYHFNAFVPEFCFVVVVVVVPSAAGRALYYHSQQLLVLYITNNQQH